MQFFKKNNLYKSLNNAFEQFEDTPPNKVWDVVEIELAKKQLNRDKKRFLWMQWSSSIIILFFICFGVYELLSYANNKEYANTNNLKNIPINNTNTLANNLTNTDNSATRSKNTVPGLNQKEQKRNNSSNNLTTHLNYTGYYNKTSNDKNLKEKIITANSESEKIILYKTYHTFSQQKKGLAIKHSLTDEINTVAKNSSQTTSKKQIVESVQMEKVKFDANKIKSKTDFVITTNSTKNISDSLIKQSFDSCIESNNNILTDTINRITSETPPKGVSKFFSRFSISVIFSPDYSSRILTNNKGVPGITVSQFNKQETPSFSFTSGLQIGCDLSDKWNIQLGVDYSSIEQVSKPTNIVADTTGSDKTNYSFSTSSGVVNFSSDNFIENDGSSISIKKDSIYLFYKADEKLEFITIPLFIRYQLSNQKISTYIIAGTTANILINKQIKLNVLNSPTNISVTTANISGLQKINIGLMFGIAFQYSLFKEMSLLIEPTLRNSVTPINKNNSVKSYPYSFGVAAGLSYHF